MESLNQAEKKIEENYNYFINLLNNEKADLLTLINNLKCEKYLLLITY